MRTDTPTRSPAALHESADAMDLATPCGSPAASPRTPPRSEDAMIVDLSYDSPVPSDRSGVTHTEPNEMSDVPLSNYPGLSEILRPPTAPTSTATSTRASRMKSKTYQVVSSREIPTPQGKNKMLEWVCVLCLAKKTLQKWKLNNTSNFWYHIRTKHPDEYNRLVGEASQHTASRGAPSASQFTRDDQREANMLLADWIVANAQPFQVVEQTPFRAFCSKLRPDFVVPCRQTIRSKIMQRWQQEKEIARIKLVKEIGMRRVGITTDLWTSPANRGYIVVTMHYIDDNWNFKSVIVGFVRVMSPHTGSRLSDHLLAAVKDMDTSLLPSVWMITGDNATNNESMINSINSNLQTTIDAHADVISTASPANATVPFASCATARTVLHLRCTAHVLQLAVKEGLKKCPIVHSSIGRLRDIMRKLHDSPKLAETLAGVCSALAVAALGPVLDVDTRWNSTWIMIHRVRELRRPLEELLRRIRERHEGYTDLSIAPGDTLAASVPDETWRSAEIFYNFLQPFKEATDLMSGSLYPTLGMVAPVYSLVSQHAAATMEDDVDASYRLFVAGVKSKLAQYT